MQTAHDVHVCVCAWSAALGILTLCVLCLCLCMCLFLQCCCGGLAAVLCLAECIHMAVHVYKAMRHSVSAGVTLMLHKNWRELQGGGDRGDRGGEGGLK